MLLPVQEIDMNDASICTATEGEKIDRYGFTMAAPVGFRDAVKRAAEAEHVSTTQFIRTAISARIRQTLAGPPSPKAEA